MDAHSSGDKASGRLTVRVRTYVLGAVIGALAFLFAATVVFDAQEKSIEQRMLAEDVVQKLWQNATETSGRLQSAETRGRARAMLLRGSCPVARREGSWFEKFNLSLGQRRGRFT